MPCFGCVAPPGQIFVAVGVVAVPSALIANGFSQVLEESRNAKHAKRRAAAVLLQRQVLDTAVGLVPILEPRTNWFLVESWFLVGVSCERGSKGEVSGVPAPRRGGDDEGRK